MAPEPQGEPERTRPASDGIGQYLFSEKIDKRTDHRGATDALRLMVPEPQGEPEGARPASDGIRQYLFSKKINKKIDHRGATDALRLMVPELQGEPEGARPASDGIGQYFYAEHKNTAPGGWNQRQTRCCGKGGNAAHRVEKDGRKLPGWWQWDFAPQGRKQLDQDA